MAAVEWANFYATSYKSPDDERISSTKQNARAQNYNFCYASCIIRTNYKMLSVFTNRLERLTIKILTINSCTVNNHETSHQN